jgi:hypothetical protein
VALTILLLGVAMSSMVHVLGWVAAERRSVERRQLATQEAANLMEHLTAEPFEKLTADSARGLSVSDEARRRLPGAELAIDVDRKAAAEDTKRLAIRLRWRNKAGAWEAPVRLTAWVARRRAR